MRGYICQFGDFRLDCDRFELVRNGHPVRVERKPLELLILLASRPGELITRTEIAERLWSSEVFVDTEHGINTAVRKLRQLLRDDSEDPQFIQTVTGKGYRFIAPISTSEAVAPDPTVAADALQAPASAAAGPSKSRIVRIALLLSGCAAVALTIFVIISAFGVHRSLRPAQPVLSPVPFTALAGVAGNPAFSPDGSRIAFVWSPEAGANGSPQSDLYVKTLGSEALLRLTQHPSASLAPAWSPDGTKIAFYRRDGPESGIFVVPALGGPEQRLHSTRDLQSAAISWSPDGKSIAFEDVIPEVTPDKNHARILLLSLETLATKPIPNNPACMEEHLPAFSHNGKYLAYWCFRNVNEAALYRLALPEGNAEMVTRSSEYHPSGLTWSPDDTRLVYSRWQNPSDDILELSVSNGSSRSLGIEGTAPALSTKGKLVYCSSRSTQSLWRRDLIDAKTPPREVVPSSRSQYDAQYSPDGKHIAFASRRSGVQEVWVSDEDGGNLVQVSDSNAPSGSPQWSPNGNDLAFDALSQNRWEIYVSNLVERKPWKLNTIIPYIARPNWSRDGKWIYFVSLEPSREGLYRCPAQGGDAIQLSRDAVAFNPKESTDGKELYFANGHRDVTLRRLALPGQLGSESTVDPSLHIRDTQSWVLTSRGIYFVPAEAPRAVRFFDFATRRTRTVFESTRNLRTGLSVSPDGRWILYSQEDELNGDVMIVDSPL